MKYIVYLTTNVKSQSTINKIYIGVHQTKNPEVFDGYIGCGVYIQQPSTYMYPKTPFQYAVKKYGVDAFKRTILFIYDDPESAYKKETELVNEDFILQPFTYNVSLGGDSCKTYKTLYQFDVLGNLVKTWEISKEAYDFYGYPKERFYYAIHDKHIFLNSIWSTSPTINIVEYNNKAHGTPKIVYLYSKQGKLVKEFYSEASCAEYCNVQPSAINKAIKANSLVQNTYYVSNKIVDEFVPKARLDYQSRTYFVYNIDNEFLGEFIGKAVMSVINLHSWYTIRDVIERQNGWYKNFYLSNKRVDKVPEKYDKNRIKVDVFDKFGNFIETKNSVKEVKIQYKIPSSKIKNLEQGEKYFGDYIFKYHKMLNNEQ